MAAHPHPAAPEGRALTRTAVAAALHCLTGCALGLVLATWRGRNGGASAALSVGLAFEAGAGAQARAARSASAAATPSGARRASSVRAAASTSSRS